MSWNLPFVDIELYKSHEKGALAKQFMQIIQQRMRMVPMGRKELAERLSITPNYLSSLLSGKRIPTIEMLVGFQFVLRIRFLVTLEGVVNYIEQSSGSAHENNDEELRAEESTATYRVSNDIRSSVIFLTNA